MHHAENALLNELGWGFHYGAVISQDGRKIWLESMRKVDPTAHTLAGNADLIWGGVFLIN